MQTLLVLMFSIAALSAQAQEATITGERVSRRVIVRNRIDATGLLGGLREERNARPDDLAPQRVRAASRNRGQDHAVETFEFRGHLLVRHQPRLWAIGPKKRGVRQHRAAMGSLERPGLGQFRDVTAERDARHLGHHACQFRQPDRALGLQNRQDPFLPADLEHLFFPDIQHGQR